MGWRSCDPEVAHQRPVRQQKHVARLDVAMYKPQPVHRLEAAEYIAADPYHLVRRNRTRFEPLLERRPVDQLHDVVLKALAFAGAKYHDDVLVADVAHHRRLAQERLAGVRGRELGPEDLDRHRTVHQYLMRAVDDAHPPLTDPVLHPIIGRHRLLQAFLQGIERGIDRHSYLRG